MDTGSGNINFSGRLNKKIEPYLYQSMEFYFAVFLDEEWEVINWDGKCADILKKARFS